MMTDGHVNVLLELAVADVQDEVLLEIVVIESCQEHKEERHIIRALVFMPRRHDVLGLLDVVGIIPMPFNELQVDGVMPLRAVVPRTDRVPATSIEQ
jgi:hypothetical protein